MEFRGRTCLSIDSRTGVLIHLMMEVSTVSIAASFKLRRVITFVLLGTLQPTHCTIEHSCFVNRLSFEQGKETPERTTLYGCRPLSRNCLCRRLENQTVVRESTFQHYTLVLRRKQGDSFPFCSYSLRYMSHY